MIYIIKEIKERFAILKNKIIAGLATTLGVLSLGVVSANADTYTVKAGDTVSAIAQAHNTSVSAIEKANKLANVNLIFIGDKLEVNGTTTTTTTSAATSAAPQSVASQATSSATSIATSASATSASSQSVASQATSSAATSSVASQASSSATSSAASSTTSTTSTQTDQQTYTQPKQTQTFSGNSNDGSVAQQMAAKTGVSAATWQQIINRESGGNANAVNASSGAYGYFQLLGHGEHAGMSAEEQVNMAANVYKAQGMSAWSETAY